MIFEWFIERNDAFASRFVSDIGKLQEKSKKWPKHLPVTMLWERVSPYARDENSGKYFESTDCISTNPTDQNL